MVVGENGKEFGEWGVGNVGRLILGLSVEGKIFQI